MKVGASLYLGTLPIGCVMKVGANLYLGTLQSFSHGQVLLRPKLNQAYDLRSLKYRYEGGKLPNLSPSLFFRDAGCQIQIQIRHPNSRHTLRLLRGFLHFSPDIYRSLTKLGSTNFWIRFASIKFGKMFARGGRLAIAASRRQLRVFEGRVAVPATACAPDWTSESLSCMRRDNARSMTTEVVGCPANEERRRRLNRILYRSRQRGYLELDLLLGKWATDNIEQLDEKRLGALVEVLEEENPDLLSWITGQIEAPENIAKNPVFSAIQRLNEHSSTETRAQPGQPWVRGWDDNRKVGGPQVGNQ